MNQLATVADSWGWIAVTTPESVRQTHQPEKPAVQPVRSPHAVVEIVYSAPNTDRPYFSFVRATDCHAGGGGRDEVVTADSTGAGVRDVLFRSVVFRRSGSGVGDGIADSLHFGDGAGVALQVSFVPGEGGGDVGQRRRQIALILPNRRPPDGDTAFNHGRLPLAPLDGRGDVG